MRYDQMKVERGIETPKTQTQKKDTFNKNAKQREHFVEKQRKI